MPTRVVKPNDPKFFLFTLIKTMAKAEKRSFKLYANRTQNTGELKIVQLFDVMDKMAELDDAEIIKKMVVTPSQLSNLKRHLYQQILSSLRLLYSSKDIDIEIREQLDYAQILYRKGLYFQSIRLLNRIKIIARDNHRDHLHLEILEFLKRIEDRHITRSRKVPGKLEQLESETKIRAAVLNHSAQLTNLKLAIHGYYFKNGHAIDDASAEKAKSIFQSRLDAYQERELTFFERVYCYQAKVRYHHILQDFAACFDNAAKWIETFDYAPHLIEEDPDLYIRGYHYALTALYNEGDRFYFKDYLGRFDRFIARKKESFNINTRIFVFLYWYNAQLNYNLLYNDFSKHEQTVSEILKGIRQYESLLDTHRILVFYYKMAYLYFKVQNYDRCQDFILKILDRNVDHLREDLQGYTRLLQMLVHYELGNFTLLASLVKSTHRFFEKAKNYPNMQKVTLGFLKKAAQRPESEHGTLLGQLKSELQALKKRKYEKRSFIFLDVLAWVES